MERLFWPFRLNSADDVKNAPSSSSCSSFFQSNTVANFNTHVGVALSASSLAVAQAVKQGLFDASQSVWYVSLGVLGGMLPDIDSDHSRLAKHLFMGLALYCASLAWLALENNLNPRPLMATVLMVFGLVRYLAAYVFQKMTVHRGVFHSLLAGIFFALLLICLRHYMLGGSKLESWLSGVFLLFGFLVHLCLDELFSVDLANGRMKKSFGTALKLYGYQNIPGSVLLLGLSAGLLAAAPSSAPLRKAFHLHDWLGAIKLESQFRHALKGMLG